VGEQQPTTYVQAQRLKCLRKLQNKELHILYCSPSMIMGIKSRRMKLIGNVLLLERTETYITFYLKILNERYHFTDIGVNER
jgi:hypothetical protein